MSGLWCILNFEHTVYWRVSQSFYTEQSPGPLQKYDITKATAEWREYRGHSIYPTRYYYYSTTHKSYLINNEDPKIDISFSS